MSKRSNSRKLAMRMVYQLDIRQATLDTIFEDLDTDCYAPDTIEWAYTLAKTTLDHLTDIDTMIDAYSIDWDMDRLNHVDKALLRLGIGEIRYTDTPPQVVINEILELSKVYSTDESARFINGILGTMVKNDNACLPD